MRRCESKRHTPGDLRGPASLGACILVLASSAMGQAPKRDALPPSLTVDVAPIEQVARLDMPAIDREAALREDALRDRKGLPPRFALPFPVQATPHDSGTWEVLDDGRLLWRVRISAPGARSINLGFSRYHMPPSGQLWLSSADGAHRVRPFDAADNEDHGQLWTPVVPGEDLVVELALRDEDLARLELELVQVASGYRGFGAEKAGGDKSGSCNVDVVCSEGDPWRDEIASVAVYSRNGTMWCTGSMVNNTSGDRTPYFLTAAHCGMTASMAPTIVVYWNYESTSCGGAANGSLADFQSGSILRANYGPTDLTLLELDDDPDGSFGVHFAGWDRSGAQATESTAIHHPNTDEKRISFELDPTTTSSYLGSASPGNSTHVRVIDWDQGTTEPGSSGSPLFDQAHRVIGQLHGGYAACGNNSSDWYGRLSVSWDGGGSASTRLSDWLDPIGSGAQTTDTVPFGMAEVWVNSSFGGAGSGTFAAPFTTLAEAVEVVLPGGRVILVSGSYGETLTLDLDGVILESYLGSAVIGS